MSQDTGRPPRGNGKDGVPLRRPQDVKYYGSGVQYNDQEVIKWTDPWAEYVSFIVSAEGINSIPSCGVYGVESTWRYYDAEAAECEHTHGWSIRCDNATMKREYYAMVIEPLQAYRKLAGENAQADRADLFDRLFDGMSDWWLRYGGARRACVIVERKINDPRAALNEYWVTQEVHVDAVQWESHWHDVVNQAVQY
jgi:hypothetical protein